MNYAIILAAGKGTRMKSETPKCALPLLNKPIVEYVLDAVKKTDTINDIIAVVGYKKDVLAEILKDDVKYVPQDIQMGTGHAVKCAKDYITGEGYTIIVPGDAPLVDEDVLNSLIDKHVRHHNACTVVTLKTQHPEGYGRILRDKNGHICCIVEDKDATEEQKKIIEVNTSVMCVNNDILFEALDEVKNDNVRGEYYLTDIINIIYNKHQQVGSCHIKESYKLHGVNNFFELSEVECHLRKSINKFHMMNGVNISNPDTVTIGKDVTIEPGTTIYQGTIITGNTVIGKECLIGPYSELNNATIEDGASCIQSLVVDSKICKNAKVGPFTHLRMNTTVGENDRVGNFVEMKNSTLGFKTNVAHLTYIGDTTCGSHVNWGCGTVTVNYDGKNKFRTEIGDNVFIGCNTNLIAPVKVESDAFIAAGSTITSTVKKGDFAIARARQVNKEDYAKKYGFKKEDKKEMSFKVIKCKDYDEASKVACEIFTNAIIEKPDLTLGLATGSTPIGMYQDLIKNYKNERISFKEVKTYNLDEYVGLPTSHPETYYNFMHRNLFDSIDINEENTHLPFVRQEHMDEDCKKYNDMLNNTSIDIQLLGIGANGHIGFNEPGTSFDQETFIVKLTDKTRQDNKRFFNSIDEVPTHAITMGIKNIMNAKKIVIMATGANKIDAVKKLLSGEVTPDFPASVLHKHNDVVVIVDKAALGE